MRSSRSKLFSGILLFVILAALVLMFNCVGQAPAGEEALHIAMVIPEKGADSFPEQKNVADLFMNQVNKAGGVNGRPVQVDFYYDGSDSPEEAMPAAEQVAADGRALLVVGHRNSNSSMAAAPIYDDAGIPSINVGASAPEVTRGRPLAFRVINDTSNLGKYAAIYVHDVLGYETASVVFEENNFGLALRDSFEKTFTQRGGRIVYSQPIAGIPEINEDGLKVASDVVRSLTPPDGEKPGLVFLAVTLNAAHELVLANHDLKSNLAMLASYAMGDVHFAERFDDPAVLDGFYAMSLLNYDVAGETAQAFYNDYVNAYDTTPSWHSGTTYDALLVALRALEATRATGQPDSVHEERVRIQKYLAGLNTPAEAVNGVRGAVYFDADHNFSIPPTFGIFDQGNFIPAPLQIRPVQNKKTIDPAVDDVVKDAGNYLYKTSVVLTGIRLNAVENLDVDKTHTFTADFYLWFRYRGDLDVANIDFLNAASPVDIGEPVASSAHNGIEYRLYRVRGQFRTTSDLRNYPFDRQEIAVQFRHRALTHEKLIYVEDTLGMDDIVRGEALLNRLKTDGAFDSVTDWFPSNPRIFIDVHSDTSSFGNPVLIGSQSTVENSTFNLKVDVKRNYFRFMLKNLLPLFCVVMLAYVSLFLPEYKFESAIGVMTGSLLSIVFFQVNLSSNLNVGYNVALDYVFYGIYLLYTIELIIIVNAWHRYLKDENSAKRLMTFARVLYPAYFFVWHSIFLLVFLYLRA